MLGSYSSRSLLFALLLSVSSAPALASAQVSQLGSPAPPGVVVVPAERAPDDAGTPPPTAGTPDPTSGAAAGVRETVDPATLEVPPPPPGAGPVYPLPGSPLRGGFGPVTSDPGVRIPSTIQTRLRALDQAFTVLVARGGGGVVEGVLGILTGGLSITLGILFDNPISPYLYTLGGTGAVRGILSLALMINPSGPAITFASMPMGDMSEVQARLEYGERELASMADQSRVARILDASLNIAGGLAIIPAYLGPQNFEIVSDFDWFVIIAAGVSSISGVITLFTTTEAERRWSIYEELRSRLEGDDDEDQAALAARELAGTGGSLVPIAGGTPGAGAMFGAAGTF